MFSIIGLIIACLIYHSVHGLPDSQIVDGTDAPNGLSDTQIVGGSDAPDGKYPYQVSLRRAFGSHFCGGAIVSKRYIITAAHCLKDVHDPNNVLIDVGSTVLYAQNRTTYKADKLISHYGYDSILHINDVGLIRLTKDITFNSNTKSIDIISSNPNFNNANFIVTGWGNLWDSGPSPRRLQQILVKGISQAMCDATFPQVNDHHICTYQGIGQGMCNGDSGGALTYKGELVGIVSFGRRPCASGNPDVFTRVYYYRSWINNYVNTASNQQLNILFGLFTMYLCINSFL